MTARSTIAAVLVAAAALTACGVSSESSAERVAPDRVPFDLLAPPEQTSAASTTPAGAPAVFLVRSDRLVAVARPGAELTPEALVAEIVAGPTAEETATGLRTAVADASLVEVVERSGELVTVDLSDAFAQLPGPDQLLAVAQLTSTLAQLDGVGAVAFRRGDQPLSVPRADGSVSQGAVTPADFAAITEP